MIIVIPIILTMMVGTLSERVSKRAGRRPHDYSDSRFIDTSAITRKKRLRVGTTHLGMWVQYDYCWVYTGWFLDALASLDF